MEYAVLVSLRNVVGPVLACTQLSKVLCRSLSWRAASASVFVAWSCRCTHFGVMSLETKQVNDKGKGQITSNYILGAHASLKEALMLTNTAGT